MFWNWQTSWEQGNCTIGTWAADSRRVMAVEESNGLSISSLSKTKCWTATGMLQGTGTNSALGVSPLHPQSRKLCTKIARIQICQQSLNRHTWSPNSTLRLVNSPWEWSQPKSLTLRFEQEVPEPSNFWQSCTLYFSPKSCQIWPLTQQKFLHL